MASVAHTLRTCCWNRREAGLRLIQRAMLPLAVALATVTLAASAQAADPFGSGSRQNLDFYFSVDGYGSGGRFEEPSDLALDERSGLFYVTDQKAGVVDAFSLQGVAKFQYGAKNGLKAPVGVAVDRQGNVFVSEAAGGSIKIINSKGETTSLDVPEDPEPGHEAPKAGRMTFDRDGTLYVVDRANSQILAFDKDRKFKFRFGSVGDKRGEFKLLQDVATDRQGRIYAADALGTPVQVFDRKGGFIYGFGMRGRGAESLSFPAGLFVDRQDQVWVVDKNQHLLKVYDRAGLYLRTFGSYGQGEGSLFYPVAAAEDSLGRVYVLEFGTRRLQVFTLAQPFEPFTP